MIPVKDIHGNTFSVSKEDPRYISGELKALSFGKRKTVTVIEIATNKRLIVNYTDERFNTGEIIKESSLYAIAKNALTGKIIGRILKTDPRWTSGEIVGIKRN